MNYELKAYIEPLTEVAQVATEGFICESIQVLQLHPHVDAYEEMDEVTLDVLDQL